MKTYRLLAVLCVLLLATSALVAQGGRDPGSSKMGREGFMWQTDIELAKEALKELEVKLERMPEDEWKETAIAWLTVEVDREGRRIDVAKTYHVGDLAAGKRSEVERGGVEYEPTFGIAFPKKPPKELKVTMDDVNSTTVDCGLGDAVKAGKGLLGVFIHESSLLCVFREAGDGAADQAPA